MIGRLAKRQKWALGLALAVLMAVAAAGACGASHPGYSALIKRLAETPAAAEGFTFVVLGDTRSDFDTAKRVLMRAAEEKPAFILATGDMVRHGSQTEYREYLFPLLDAIAPIPLIPVPGNHDEGPAKDFAAFKAIYGADHFSFEYGGSRFVGLNNCAGMIALGDEAMGFLKTELSKPGARHTFVLMHIPPRYVEEAAASTHLRGFRWNASAFRRLLQESKVDQAFFGHIHAFASRAIDGVRYTITGGGGAPLTESLGPEAGVYNLVVVHVGPQGVRTEVLRRVGETWLRSEIS